MGGVGKGWWCFGRDMLRRSSQRKAAWDTTFEYDECPMALVDVIKEYMELVLLLGCYPAALSETDRKADAGAQQADMEPLLVPLWGNHIPCSKGEIWP
jgi:hypothetical protein